METKKGKAFAIWVTGLPASGKSTLAASLQSQLAEKGINTAVLESDALRKIFTPHPHYDDAEREDFYRQMVFVGALLTQFGTPVIFDATANRRRYRDLARQQIPQFLEVYVDSPLEICAARDPKGIYRRARADAANTVPGLQAPYEPPVMPDVVFRGDQEPPESAARRVIAKLAEKGYLSPAGSH